MSLQTWLLYLVAAIGLSRTAEAGLDVHRFAPSLPLIICLDFNRKPGSS